MEQVWSLGIRTNNQYIVIQIPRTDPWRRYLSPVLFQFCIFLKSARNLTKGTAGEGKTDLCPIRKKLKLCHTTPPPPPPFFEFYNSTCRESRVTILLLWRRKNYSPLKRKKNYSPLKNKNYSPLKKKKTILLCASNQEPFVIFFFSRKQLEGREDCQQKRLLEM